MPNNVTFDEDGTDTAAAPSRKNRRDIFEFLVDRGIVPTKRQAFVVTIIVSVIAVGLCTALLLSVLQDNPTQYEGEDLHLRGPEYP